MWWRGPTAEAPGAASSSRSGVDGARTTVAGRPSVDVADGAAGPRVGRRPRRTRHATAARGTMHWSPRDSGPRSIVAAQASVGRGLVPSIGADRGRRTDCSASSGPARNATRRTGSLGSSRMDRSQKACACVTAATTRRAVTPRTSSWGRWPTTTATVTRRGVRTGRAGRIIRRGRIRRDCAARATRARE